MQPIILKISGVGHIPSFKNSKQIIPGKGKQKSMLITKPEYQAVMAKIVDSFTSQLISQLATRGIEITTGPTLLFRIASLLPLDDSRKWIPSHSVNTLLVSKGNEGATITITLK